MLDIIFFGVAFVVGVACICFESENETLLDFLISKGYKRFVCGSIKTLYFLLIVIVIVWSFFRVDVDLTSWKVVFQEEGINYEYVTYDNSTPEFQVKVEGGEFVVYDYFNNPELNDGEVHTYYDTFDDDRKETASVVAVCKNVDDVWVDKDGNEIEECDKDFEDVTPWGEGN